MLNYLKEAYRDSFRVAVALPWLFALPVTTELVQHVIEYRIGMFESLAAMEAVANHPARMGFGQVKILSLVLLFYWVCRWQVYRDDPAQPVVGDRRSALLFGFVLLYGIALGVVQQFGGGWLAPFVVDLTNLILIGFAFFFATMALEIYLSVWKVGAALGNARLGIPASFRIMRGNFWWSLGFSLVMLVPLMAIHYMLNGVAVGRPFAALWAILILDALVVGYLGLVLATTVFIIARRATEHAGIALAASDERLGAPTGT